MQFGKLFALNVYEIVRDSFVNQGVVFFGGHAINLYKAHIYTSSYISMYIFIDSAYIHLYSANL